MFRPGQFVRVWGGGQIRRRARFNGRAVQVRGWWAGAGLLAVDVDGELFHVPSRRAELVPDGAEAEPATFEDSI